MRAVTEQEIRDSRKAYRKLLEAAQFVKRTNCVKVQAQIDRGQQPTVGTCWWYEKGERLYSVLPANACWVCKLHDAVKDVELLLSESQEADRRGDGA